MPDRPDALHLVRHRDVRFVAFVAAVIAVFGVVALIATAVAGGGLDGWAMAAAGLASLAGVALVLWVLLSLWLRTNERRHADAVIAGAKAVWPQYSTPAQWDKDVEDAVELHDADTAQVVGPAVVLSAAVALIAVVAAVTGDARPALVAGAGVLGVVWLVAGATVVARSTFERRARARTRARLSAIEPFPRCWLSEDGAYFEDTGLVRFDRFADVTVVEPGGVSAHREAIKRSGHTTGATTDLTPLDTRLSKSGWALLAITLDSSTPRTFWLKVERAFRGQRQRYDWVSTLHVRVPPPEVARAHELALHIRRRWLG